jgi:PAS domain S-box-containing protein
MPPLFDPSRSADLLWEHSFEALAVVDDERRYLRVNQATGRLLGDDVDAIVGDRIDRFTPPERLAVLEQLWDGLLRRGTLHGPYEMLRGDGTRGLIEFRAVREFGRSEHLIVAREITPDPRWRRPAEPWARDRDLTARERQVLQLAADGGSTREVAEVLVVSPGTVKTHFEHIYEKLGVGDRTAAVAQAMRTGVIH